MYYIIVSYNLNFIVFLNENHENEMKIRKVDLKHTFIFKFILINFYASKSNETA